MTPNIVESEMKGAMVRAASHRTVLADHTKIGMVGLAPFAAWSAIDVLITGLPLPESFEHEIRAQGVTTRVAHEDPSRMPSTQRARRGRPAGRGRAEGSEP